MTDYLTENSINKLNEEIEHIIINKEQHLKMILFFIYFFIGSLFNFALFKFFKKCKARC